MSYAKQLDRRELQAEAGLIPRSMGDRHRQVDSLSKREHDVARLLIEGESNKRIAALLGISPRTAQFHVRRIIAKLGANNRVDAAVTYVRWQFAKERDHRLEHSNALAPAAIAGDSFAHAAPIDRPT